MKANVHNGDLMWMVPGVSGVEMNGIILTSAISEPVAARIVGGGSESQKKKKYF